MKILGFRSHKVNGYLSLNVNFRSDLTFVTGINGTGKTTVLNSLIALLMPRLDFLTTHEYERISILLEDSNNEVVLSATRSSDGAILQASHLPYERFVVTRLEWDDTASISRNREAEQNFHREQLARNASNPVLKYIQSLPTPMFLGLDRRTLATEESTRYSPRPHYYTRSRRRNVFSTSLSQSLTEAQSYAFESFRSAQRLKSELDERFRQDLVLDLIQFKPEDKGFILDEPKEKDYLKLTEIKENLARLPELLGVDAAKVAERVDPLLSFIGSTYEKISSINPNDKKRRDERLSAMIEWSYNKSHLTRISSISERITKYNQQSERLFRQTANFLRAVNIFFEDSTKTIKFDSFGELVFTVPEVKDDRDLRALSSGEIQLIVILAHLHFNPEVRKASIFIIDEPELSLHVEWQEKFVDTMLSSSKNTQFIMATHSPSIILEKVGHCIDLTPGA